MKRKKKKKKKKNQKKKKKKKNKGPNSLTDTKNKTHKINFF